MTRRFDAIAIGDCLPTLELPAVDRARLALFAGASGDHNPIHIDLDVARRAGMPDVFAQGMLCMAWLGRQLTAWVPQSAIREFSVRFAGVTHLRDVLSCSGIVVEKLAVHGERCVRLQLRAENQYGEQKLVGEALIALDQHSEE